MHLTKRRKAMSFNNIKPLGNWGQMTPVNDSGSIHITQTNINSRDGLGAHVTTQIGGASIHDRFDSNGNFLNTDIGIFKK
jgi:hypothetical protein